MVGFNLAEKDPTPKPIDEILKDMPQHVIPIPLGDFRFNIPTIGQEPSPKAKIQGPRLIMPAFWIRAMVAIDPRGAERLEPFPHHHLGPKCEGGLNRVSGLVMHDNNPAFISQETIPPSTTTLCSGYASVHET